MAKKTKTSSKSPQFATNLLILINTILLKQLLYARNKYTNFDA